MITKLKLALWTFLLMLIMQLFGPNGSHSDPYITEGLTGYGYEHKGWYEP